MLVIDTTALTVVSY